MPSIADLPPSSRLKLPWFGLGMAAIFLASLALRFWGLSRFNVLVFDEVYYAKFASAFLRGEIVFTGHPPLSTYIVAIGIWIGERLPWATEPKNDLTGLLLSPFSYRWLNALTGSLIPLVVGAIAYQLLQRRLYAWLAALLIAADGLFLVESRYALNNVYLILLGLLGHLFFLMALRATAGRRWLYLILAGIGLGGAAAIKWNGLGFLLGAGAVWATGWLVEWLQTIRASLLPAHSQSEPRQLRPLSPLQNLTHLHLGHVLVALVIMPAVTYYVSWLPYIYVDPSDSDFWQLQSQTYDYHRRVGGMEAHPYCSRWYTWPLMLRPVAYFYQTTQNSTDALPLTGLPQPPSLSNVIYDVHAMGNPMLWWFSTAAVVLFGLLLLQQLWLGFAAMSRQAANQTAVNQISSQSVGSQVRSRQPASRTAIPDLVAQPPRRTTVYLWAAAYLLINWSANFFPWMRVTRCLFIYHYMGSLIFAVLLLALLLDRWLHGRNWQKSAAVAVIGLTLIGFVFWMPLFLGLPLSPEALQLRRWFDSWV